MASDLLLDAFPRGFVTPRYNKSLDSLDCALDAHVDSRAPQNAASGSEGDILGLHPLSSPRLVTQLLSEHFTSESQTGLGAHSPVAGPSRLLCDRVDPEDSIRDMVSENDFYRFVLFKRHYEKYLRLSQKYEEARNIAYYLEEKYHEIKGERDELARTRRELERRVEQRDAQLMDKDEELFLQLERVVRLEEECDKLRSEKERFAELQRQLQAERDAALRQMRQQATESEQQRRSLERARCDVVRQATIIAKEKENLERENEQLREALNEERRGIGNFLEDMSQQKSRANQSVAVLEKELSELQMVSQQTATLNSQFKKGMKHLATCKRRKCHVCNYTRATFGDYADRYRHQRKLFSCIQAPLEDLRQWIRPASAQDKHSVCSQEESEDLLHCSPARAPSVSGPSGLSYIDSDESSSSSEQEDEEVSTSSYEDEERELGASSLPTDVSLTSSSTAAGRAFSSDSGFSSELCDSKITHADVDGATPSPTPPKSSLHRSKWTASFRKLIHRVSKR